MTLPIEGTFQMKEEDYPALYISSDLAAQKAQKQLLNNYKLTSGLLLLGAVLATKSPNTAICSVLSGLMFLSLLGIHVYGYTQKHQDKWYRARALAESIKTATWRFMMQAEPFDKSTDCESLEAYKKLLLELLREHKDLGHVLAGDASSKDQVTEVMTHVRQESYESKSQIYLKSRIDEQRNWYAKKSKANSDLSKKFFVLTCLLYFAAVVWLLMRVQNPNFSYLPIEILALLASGLLGWVQLKRYDELVSSYALTAHEIGIIKSKFSELKNQEGLSLFVSDAENAFSREHTQWAARRDH